MKKVIQTLYTYIIVRYLVQGIYMLWEPEGADVVTTKWSKVVT